MAEALDNEADELLKDDAVKTGCFKIKAQQGNSVSGKNSLIV